MRTLLFKYICMTLLLVPFTAMAVAGGGGMKGKYTKEKTIKKEFDVNSDALLKVKNSYGNLTLTSWDQDKVMIEVYIKTNGNNEDKVQDRLDEIDVDFDGSSNMVSAITRFGNRNNSWGWKWGKRNNVSIQVNYTIKLPVKNSINLSNDYGNIYLDRVDGHAKINCDYGKMEVGQLRGRNNELRFDYTSRSTFDYINSAEIIADYSGFTVEKAGDLKVNADYTNAVIREMEDLDYTCDYGSMEVSKVKSVSGSGDYIGIKFGEVGGSVSVTADYGSVKIEELTPDAGDVNIRSDYTGIKIGYSPDYHFDFDITTEYAGVNGIGDFEIQIRKEKSSEKYYNGYYGSDNSGNVIQIDSEYGGVSFYKN
ncbi:MAG: hypothetical protein AAF039_00425 [Bacteroidota bacterium]